SWESPLRSPSPFWMQALLHDQPDVFRHDIARCATVDDDAALRFLARERPIGLTKFFVKFHRLRLEPVGSILPTPARGPPQSDLRGDVQDESEFRKGRPNGDPLQAPNQALVDIAEDTLIDAR